MRTGLLLLHGFSGGPYEVEPLTHFLKQKTGWVVEVPTFSGHGDADSLAMKGYKAEHWLMDAELAYRRLAKMVDEVVVVGFSMGGIIAIHIANRYRVKKLVLLSAAAKYVSPLQLVQDIRVMAVEAFHGRLTNNKLFLRYEYKFRNVPLRSTVEFMKIVRQTIPYIGNIRMPVFIIQGKLDGIVPHTTAQMLYDQIPAKEKTLYISNNGKHHICYSDDCEVWFEKVYTFLMASHSM